MVRRPWCRLTIFVLPAEAIRLCTCAELSLQYCPTAERGKLACGRQGEGYSPQANAPSLNRKKQPFGCFFLYVRGLNMEGDLACAKVMARAVVLHDKRAVVGEVDDADGGFLAIDLGIDRAAQKLVFRAQLGKIRGVALRDSAKGAVQLTAKARSDPRGAKRPAALQQHRGGGMAKRG